MPMDSFAYEPSTWSRWKPAWIWWPKRTVSGKLTAGRCYKRMRLVNNWRRIEPWLETQYAANEFDMLRADKHEAPL